MIGGRGGSYCWRIPTREKGGKGREGGVVVGGLIRSNDSLKRLERTIEQIQYRWCIKMREGVLNHIIVQEVRLVPSTT